MTAAPLEIEKQSNLVDASVIVCVHDRPVAVQKCVESLFATNTYGFDIVSFDEALAYGCDENDLANRLAKNWHLFASAPNTIVYYHHPIQWRRYLKTHMRQGYFVRTFVDDISGA